MLCHNRLGCCNPNERHCSRLAQTYLNPYPIASVERRARERRTGTDPLRTVVCLFSPPVKCTGDTAASADSSMSEAAWPHPLPTLVEEEGDGEGAPPLRINFTMATMVGGEAPPTLKLNLSLSAMLEEDEIEIDVETSSERKAADGGGGDAVAGKKIAVEKPGAEVPKPARAPRQRPKQRVAAALENENIRGNNMPYVEDE